MSFPQEDSFPLPAHYLVVYTPFQDSDLRPAPLPSDVRLLSPSAETSCVNAWISFAERSFGFPTPHCRVASKHRFSGQQHTWSSSFSVIIFSPCPHSHPAHPRPFRCFLTVVSYLYLLSFPSVPLMEIFRGATRICIDLFENPSDVPLT